VDANAVSPATVREVAGLFERFVDGGIIGGPSAPRLHLAVAMRCVSPRSSTAAASTRTCWTAEVGAASALKMVYAAWTKGTAALLLAIRDLARAEGVDEALVAEWRDSLPDLEDRLARAERSAACEGLALGRRDGADRSDVRRERPAAGVPRGRGGGLPPLARAHGRVKRLRRAARARRGRAPDGGAPRRGRCRARPASRPSRRSTSTSAPSSSGRSVRSTFVADGDGRLVGMLHVEVSRFGFGELGMCVDRDWRGRGVGTALVLAAIEWSRAEGLHKLCLEVWPTNAAAIALYRKHGFVEEGRRVKQLRRASGELWDTLVMGLLL
jgi:RimJ/RimL family protein N-acetyltransferase